MPHPLHHHLQDLLGSSFELRRELPGAGMSRVFVAWEPALKREVVVKVLPPDLRSTTSLARFSREIEVTAGLQHPHILPVMGTGGDERTLYYVAPFVAGGSARERLRSRKRIEFAEAVRYGADVLSALSFAHQHGVLHRDIKPGNVLLSGGHAILADFGIAALMDALHESEPEHGASIASPEAYLAPERPRDARADLYAAAVLTFELLTGSHPTDTRRSAIMVAIAAAHPRVSAARVRAVSRALSRALSHDPERRYPSAAQFRSALVEPTTDAWPRRRRFRAAISVAAAVIANFVRGGRAPNPASPRKGGDRDRARESA